MIRIRYIMEYFIPDRFQTVVSKSSASSEFGDADLGLADSPSAVLWSGLAPLRKAQQAALGISFESRQKAELVRRTRSRTKKRSGR
jgi:hypothetical protein